MRGMFDHEGPLLSFLDKVGQLVILSVLWILGCLPVVTVVPSTAALYYAVMKSVRRERESAAGEFWKSFRANLKRGVPITLLALALTALICGNIWILREAQTSLYNGVRIGNMLLLALLAVTAVYVGPVLSRFDMGVKSVLKLSFVMAIRFLPRTLLILAAALAVGYLQFYVLPMPVLLLLPALCCYGATFLIEKALRTYMPEKKPGDDAWYYE